MARRLVRNFFDLIIYTSPGSSKASELVRLKLLKSTAFSVHIPLSLRLPRLILVGPPQ